MNIPKEALAMGIIAAWLAPCGYNIGIPEADSYPSTRAFTLDLLTVYVGFTRRMIHQSKRTNSTLSPAQHAQKGAIFVD